MAKNQIITQQTLSAKKLEEINKGYRILYHSESEEIARMKVAFAKFGIK